MPVQIPQCFNHIQRGETGRHPEQEVEPLPTSPLALELGECGPENFRVIDDAY